MTLVQDITNGLETESMCPFCGTTKVVDLDTPLYKESIRFTRCYFAYERCPECGELYVAEFYHPHNQQFLSMCGTYTPINIHQLMYQFGGIKPKGFYEDLTEEFLAIFGTIRNNILVQLTLKYKDRFTRLNKKSKRQLENFCDMAIHNLTGYYHFSTIDNLIGLLGYLDIDNYLTPVEKTLYKLACNYNHHAFVGTVLNRDIYGSMDVDWETPPDNNYYYKLTGV